MDREWKWGNNYDRLIEILVTPLLPHDGCRYPIVIIVNERQWWKWLIIALSRSTNLKYVMMMNPLSTSTFFQAYKEKLYTKLHSCSVKSKSDDMHIISCTLCHVSMQNERGVSNDFLSTSTTNGYGKMRSWSIVVVHSI